LQKEIVTSIESELNAEIKSGEIHWTKNLLPENKQALYFYWEGQELRRSYSFNNDIKLLQQAKEKYELALKMDSGFVLPMVQLGWICMWATCKEILPHVQSTSIQRLLCSPGN
jgi:hypothetical protein